MAQTQTAIRARVPPPGPPSSELWRQLISIPCIPRPSSRSGGQFLADRRPLADACLSGTARLDRKRLLGQQPDATRADTARARVLQGSAQCVGEGGSCGVLRVWKEALAAQAQASWVVEAVLVRFSGRTRLPSHAPRGRGLGGGDGRERVGRVYPVRVAPADWAAVAPLGAPRSLPAAVARIRHEALHPLSTAAQWTSTCATRPRAPLSVCPAREGLYPRHHAALAHQTGGSGAAGRAPRTYHPQRCGNGGVAAAAGAGGVGSGGGDAACARARRAGGGRAWRRVPSTPRAQGGRAVELDSRRGAFICGTNLVSACVESPLTAPSTGRPPPLPARIPPCSGCAHPPAFHPMAAP